jgi:hypothetical protein
MKMKAYASFDDFVDGQTAANQAVVRELCKLVKRVARGLVETVKWGNGCWVKGKKPVAFAYGGPDHVQFGFFAGSKLKDPGKILEGSGAYVRHVKIRSRSDIDARALGALLRQAVKVGYGKYE